MSDWLNADNGKKEISVAARFFLITDYLFIKIVICATVLLFLKFDILAQEKNEQELFNDSISLFSITGNAETEIFAKGFWEVQLISSGSLGFSENTGFDILPLLPKNNPGFSAGLLINKQWFVETNIKENVKDSTFTAGWLGNEGDYLRKVIIGNSDIDFPSFPFSSIGKGLPGSFGVSVAAGNNESSINALVRYDRGKIQKKVFLGSNEIIENKIEVTSYLKGRFFDSPFSSTAEFFIESVNGPFTGSDGKKYRYLGYDEYQFSAVTGKISLNKVIEENRVLLITGGLDVVVDGKACTFLYPSAVNQAVPENRQFLNRYPAMDIPQGARLSLRDKATGALMTGYSVYLRQDETIELNRDDAVPDSIQERFPLMDIGGSGVSSWLYDSEAIIPGDYSDKDYPVTPVEIIVRYETGTKEIQLPSSVKKSTIEIKRNGISDYSFIFDESSGIIKLTPDPGKSELIEVTYFTESDELTDGVLVAALAGEFYLNKIWSIWSAFGIRWGIPGYGYSQPENEYPGLMTLSGGAKGESGTFSLESSLALEFRRENATGILLMENMENSSLWKSPFRTLNGEAIALVDEKLEEAFPVDMERFHSKNEEQKILELRLAGSSTMKAYKYYETIPVRNYRRFVFYAESESTEAELIIRIGTPDSDAVRIVVPFSGGISGWRKYILDYQNGNARLLGVNPENYAEYLVPGGQAFIDPTIDGKLLEIFVNSVNTDDIVRIDELHFDEPSTELSAYGNGIFSFFPENANFGSVFGMPFFYFKRTDISAKGCFGRDSAFGGMGASGIMGLGPAEINITMSLGISENEISTALGHKLNIVNIPIINFSDEFNLDSAEKNFARTNNISIDFSPFLLTALEASAFSRTGIFSQNWSFSADSTSFSTSLDAEFNGSSMIDLQFLNYGYGSMWLETTKFLLPAFESESVFRSAHLQFDILKKKQLFYSGLMYQIEPDLPIFIARLNAELGWRLDFESLTLRPWYRKIWKDESTKTGSSYLMDVIQLGNYLAEETFLWKTIPFFELFQNEITTVFENETNTSNYALLTTETGITWKRPSISEWYNLLIPLEGELGLGRILQRKRDIITDEWVIKADIHSQVLNLFGALGAYPFFHFYSMDEFSARTNLLLKINRNDGDKSILINNILKSGIYYGLDNSVFAENRFSFEKTADGFPWSNSLAMAWTTSNEKSWLKTIVDSIINKNQNKKNENENPDWLSSYFSEIFTKDRISQREIRFSVAYAKKEPFGEITETEAKESYESRYTIPDRLSVSFSIALNQNFSDSGIQKAFTFGYEIILTSRIMF